MSASNFRFWATGRRGPVQSDLHTSNRTEAVTRFVFALVVAVTVNVVGWALFSAFTGTRRVIDRTQPIEISVQYFAPRKTAKTLAYSLTHTPLPSDRRLKPTPFKLAVASHWQEATPRLPQQTQRVEAVELPAPANVRPSVLPAQTNQTGPSAMTAPISGPAPAPSGETISQQGEGGQVISPASPSPGGILPRGTPIPSPPAVQVGPTSAARALNQVLPVIPSDLTEDDYESAVRVSVNIHADGAFDVTLLTSSGNKDVDRNVLTALKKWKWQPALKNGAPADSIQNFRFEFEVH